MRQLVRSSVFAAPSDQVVAEGNLQHHQEGDQDEDREEPCRPWRFIPPDDPKVPNRRQRAADEGQERNRLGQMQPEGDRRAGWSTRPSAPTASHRPIAATLSTAPMRTRRKAAARAPAVGRSSRHSASGRSPPTARTGAVRTRKPRAAQANQHGQAHGRQRLVRPHIDPDRGRGVGPPGAPPCRP